MNQLFPDSQWHPVAFLSRKMQPAERNYEVYDQELLAIVYCFKEWRHYLEGSQHTIQIYTDHNNLRGISAVQKLNPRQARWATFLAGFDFDIHHRAGKLNPADGPSRRPDYFTENGAIRTLLPTLQQRLRLAGEIQLPGEVHAEIARVCIASGARGSTTKQSLDIEGEAPVESIRSAAVPDPAAGATGCTQYVPRQVARVLLAGETARDDDGALARTLLALQKVDPFVRSIRARVAQGMRKTHSGRSPVWSIDSTGLVRHSGRLFIPDNAESIKQEVLLQCHDSKMAGHFGAARTQELIGRSYHWNNFEQSIRSYVRTCAICQRAKAPRHMPYGQLASLPIPDNVWEELSMDFVTGLPPSKCNECVYNAILVIVDRYSKMALYIPAKKSWDARDLADAFFQNVICRFGTPKGVVSDRGSVFTSAFWTEVCYQTQMKRRLSTAFYPQTDGQTERQNQVLEQYLRIFCSEEQDNWASLLATAEFAYNNSVHSSTGSTPFLVVYGKHPRLFHPPEDSRLEGEVPAAVERVERIRQARETLEKRVQDAQAYQQRVYNAKHTPMAYKPGEHVLLSVKNLKLRQPSKKLSEKYIGPFVVVEAVGAQAYRIRLPPKYRMHNVFHVSLLKPYRSRPGWTGDNAAEPDLAEDGTEVWQVEQILKQRTKRGKQEYLLRWKGYSPDWDSWVPASEFENMDELLQEFQTRKR